MEVTLQHAQLVDETAPALDALRRNIRIARTLALHLDRPTCRYDHALNALAEVEADMKTVSQEAVDLFNGEEGIW